MTATGAKGLLLWCQQCTEGYSGVKVENFTTSWKDGLAFCALLHHFYPDKIDFDSLKPGDTEKNCKIAFSVCDQVGIPQFLEVDDMVNWAVPDKMSITLQLSQYFKVLSPLSPSNSGHDISTSGKGSLHSNNNNGETNSTSSSNTAASSTSSIGVTTSSPKPRKSEELFEPKPRRSEELFESRSRKSGEEVFAEHLFGASRSSSLENLSRIVSPEEVKAAQDITNKLLSKGAQSLSFAQVQLVQENLLIQFAALSNTKADDEFKKLTKEWIEVVQRKDYLVRNHVLGKPNRLGSKCIVM